MLLRRAKPSVTNIETRFFTALKEQGTKAAVDVLPSVAQSLPQLGWLDSAVAHADRQRLRLELEWCRSGLLICDGSESSSKIR